MVRVRLISLGLVLGVAFLLIVSLVLDTAIQAAGKWLWGASPLVIVGDIVQFVAGLVILSAAFGALMKFLPDGHVAWRDALIGGVVAAVLFSVGKKLFALYLTHAGTANAFGAAGSLAVLLMWLYFAAAVLLLGAEFSAARARDDKERTQENAAPSPTPQPGELRLTAASPVSGVAPRTRAPSLDLRRHLFSAEAHIARSAARTLSLTNRVVRQSPWRAALVAATAGLAVALTTGARHGQHRDR
jgi:membrane protein